MSYEPLPPIEGQTPSPAFESDFAASPDPLLPKRTQLRSSSTSRSGLGISNGNDSGDGPFTANADDRTSSSGKSDNGFRWQPVGKHPSVPLGLPTPDSTEFKSSLRVVDTETIGEKAEGLLAKGYSNNTPMYPNDKFRLDSFSTPRLSSTPRWTIGWKIPASIGASYLAAVITAGTHLFLFRWLNGQQVTHAVPQTYVTTASTAFITLFRTFLSTALAISITQILWQRFRTRPMKISTIDMLLSLTTNPSNLAYPEVFVGAPLLYICAALYYCLPIAMVHPPGAMIVASLPFVQDLNITVPTFDPSYQGEVTFMDLAKHALFRYDRFINYKMPQLSLSRVGKQTITMGSYRTSPSPCGQNCSYTLEVLGPGYLCEDLVSYNLSEVINDAYPGTEPFVYYDHSLFMAAESSNRSVTEYRFNVTWLGEGNVSPQYLSCVAQETVYSMNVSYLNGQQAVETNIVSQKVLEPLQSLGNYSDFYPLDKNQTVSELESQGVNVIEHFRRANLIAVKDTLVRSLSGLVAQASDATRKILNTLVQESNFAHLMEEDVQQAPFFIVPTDAIQELMQNITISMLTLNQSSTMARVRKTDYVNYFVFNDPLKLILPYFVCLALAVPFIFAAGTALRINGVSASSNSFLQTLCTTRGCERLDRAAAEGCLGGPDNVPEELERLKVLFGELVSEDGEGTGQAGFGPVGEVRPLVKGQVYGRQ